MAAALRLVLPPREDDDARAEVERDDDDLDEDERDDDARPPDERLLEERLLDAELRDLPLDDPLLPCAIACSSSRAFAPIPATEDLAGTIS
ncbi:MAG TPA: hypothetical protein VF752_12445 [Thermoleophilaceae bacterium]